MQQKTIVIILLLLLSLTLTKRYNPNKQKIIQQQSQKIYQYTQNKYLFEQIVDHFNYQSSTTWKQRYWAIDNYFNPKVGPVFLYICGEYTCPGVPSSRQWVVTLAQRTQGLILVLQHRFYGESLPFGNSSFNLQNLKLLNSQQALKDLAYFLDQVNTTNLFQVHNNPWITIGGSYPGALSAWFRYKYPHLTIGGIASSAVVQAIEDFPQFDEQIYTSSFLSGQFCVDALNKSSILVQNVLNSTQAMIFKSQFKDADKLSDNQFLFFWVDSIVGAIQYGSRTSLCDSLKNKSEGQQFETIISLVQQNQVYQYGSYFLKNQTFAYLSGQGSRSWYYQSCSEFGFWQTMNLHHPMRSSRLTIDFYRKFCSDSFQTGLWPKVQRKNIEYGGLKQQNTNLLMVNGVEDPWRWASIQQSQGKIISRVANCSNCAHCVDLYTPSTNDSPELKQIRSQQYLTILNWIEQFWKKPIFHIRTQLEEE